MKCIAADRHRAAEIIDGIRSNFRQDQRGRTRVDLNRLITETAALLQAELRRRHIRVHLQLGAQPAEVLGDRIFNYSRCF